MDDVIEQLIGEPVPANRKINSPFNPADETPSFHCYETDWYDYSTGRHGDVITLVRELRKCSFEEAIELLESEADDLGLVAVEREKVEKPPFVVPEFRPVFGSHLRPPGVSVALWNTLVASGVVMAKDVETLAIVHRNPYTLDAVGIKYRHISGRKTSEPGSDFSSFLYQPFDYQPTIDYCIITEGETDSWAWFTKRPAYEHVYSLPSGANSWRDKFLDQLSNYDKVFLAFDNDAAGKQATDKVTRAIGWGRTELVQIPSLYKDVREAVAAGWTPSLRQDQYGSVQ